MYVQVFSVVDLLCNAYVDIQTESVQTLLKFASTVLQVEMWGS